MKGVLCCAVQASAQLDALGDHQTLLNEHSKADARQRKLCREQVSCSSTPVWTMMMCDQRRGLQLCCTDADREHRHQTVRLLL